MSLIERQAAIDALRDWEMCYDWDEHCREEPKAPWVVSPSGVINKLPSAQLGTDLAEVGTDCISRQQVIDALNRLRESTYSADYGIVDCDDAINAIADLPPTEPKRGKWIKYEQEFMLEGSLGTVQKTVRECSVCTAKIAGMVGIMNFCPNCGADMRGGQE